MIIKAGSFLTDTIMSIHNHFLEKTIKPNTSITPKIDLFIK